LNGASLLVIAGLTRNSRRRDGCPHDGNAFAAKTKASMRGASLRMTREGGLM
jgi:hypothetical protein